MAPGVVTDAANIDGEQVQMPVKHATGPLAEFAKYGNPALHVTPEHTLELKDTEVPRPAHNEALVHVRCTGICGSDMHLWKGGRIGPLVVDRHCILGHEAAGQVVAVGSGVTHLKPGDRVAIEPGVPCEQCWLCYEGKYNLCEAVKFAGVCPYAGSIRRFMNHSARFLHKIPDGMTYSQGALLEPLAVILHAIRSCEGSIGIGRPALICGAGPIGLIALSCAKANGAWPLVITDVDASRLEFAKKLIPGIKTYQVSPDKSAIETSEEIRALYGCAPRDVEAGVWSPTEYLAPTTVLECTGFEPSIVTAAYSVRRAGLVMVVGVGKSIVHNVPFMHLSLAEINLKFINRYWDTWPAGINAMAESAILDLDKLVTHTFSLEQALEAMETCADRTKGGVKIQIVDNTDIQIPGAA